MEKILVEFQDLVTHLINTGQLTHYAISTLLSQCDQWDFKSVQEGALTELQNVTDPADIYIKKWLNVKNWVILMGGKAYLSVFSV